MFMHTKYETARISTAYSKYIRLFVRTFVRSFMLKQQTANGSDFELKQWHLRYFARAPIVRRSSKSASQPTSHLAVLDECERKKTANRLNGEKLCRVDHEYVVASKHKILRSAMLCCALLCPAMSMIFIRDFGFLFSVCFICFSISFPSILLEFVFFLAIEWHLKHTE